MINTVVAVFEDAMIGVRSDEAVAVDSFVAMQLGRMIGRRKVVPQMLQSGNIPAFHKVSKPCSRPLPTKKAAANCSRRR